MPSHPTMSTAGFFQDVAAKVSLTPGAAMSESWSRSAPGEASLAGAHRRHQTLEGQPPLLAGVDLRVSQPPHSPHGS